MIVLATYPRSGNTFLVNSMRAALGDRIKYCESHKQKFDPATHNVVKTHDFELDFKKPTGWKVVVQLRYPPDAIASWFNLERGARVKADTLEEWRKFYPSAAKHYRDMLKRWLPGSDLILWYRDLMATPEAALAAVIRLGWEDFPIPAVKIDAPPRKPTTSKKFQHYRKEDFDLLKILCQTGDPNSPPTA